MSWRESFQSMDEGQRRRFAILADCRDREGDKPDRLSVFSMGQDEHHQKVWLAGGARVVERSLVRRHGGKDFGEFMCGAADGEAHIWELVYCAHLRGIDLDPIADAVLAGEERQFLDRISATTC